MSGVDEIAAIDARLAELDEERHERKRIALLEELDGPHSDDLATRVNAFIAADLERAERMPDGAHALAVRAYLRQLLDGSRVVDPLPASMAVDGAANVCVVSASLGRIRVGPWDATAIAEAERLVLLEARKAVRDRERKGSRGGITREMLIQAALANREPDGTWPTQDVVAEKVERTPERVRQVQGPGGWPGVLADAQRRIAEG